jgi:hypothetical protein
MANTLKPVAVAELTAAFTTLYTVPGATKFTVGQLHLVNASPSAKTVRVCVVPSAGSPLQSNAILWDFSIAANDFIELAKGDIWDTGVTLQALASAGTSVNVKLAGVETT